MDIGRREEFCRGVTNGAFRRGRNVRPGAGILDDRCPRITNFAVATGATGGASMVHGRCRPASTYRMAIGAGTAGHRGRDVV